MENSIKLKPISELLGKNFFIPSYQRGYRWTQQQVEDLLNDIEEYDSSKDGKFYCLQPLVVKKNDGKWDVIDGQQRLTTICLIISYLAHDKQLQLEYQRNPYIEEVKKTSCDVNEEFEEFWANYIRNSHENDNSEFYHLLQAKYVIEKWFSSKNDETKKVMLDKFLDETKFIWYNVGDADEHKLFKNLNSGKIALTNAELIKALFLNNTGNDVEEKALKQNLIAEEYDQIERSLREDDFWYFLAGNCEKPSSCIDLLFDLMLDSTDRVKFEKFQTSKDALRTFYYFKHIIQHDEQGNDEVFAKTEKVWRDVQTHFYTLEGWYKNAEHYNLIGFLRALKTPKYLHEIYIEWEKVGTKEEFVSKFLKEQAKSAVSYKDDEYLGLNYGSANTRNLLLFLNIAVLLENADKKVKFSFANFHKSDWDIEHITPQNPKDFKELIEQGDVILSRDLQQKNDEEREKLKDRIVLPSEFDDWSGMTEKDKQELIGKYITNEPNKLSNLTLLSARDNRGIGNMYFFEKREKLKQNFQTGSFIPPCSMNVFVKFYTVNPDNLNFWSEEDGKAYINFIESTISKFFKINHE